MASPEWNQNAASAHTFGRKGRVITPGDTDIDPIPKAIVMCADGDISIVPDGETVAISFVGVAAGWMPPYVVRRVTACSSSCATVDA